jgi:hypothetical protein
MVPSIAWMTDGYRSQLGFVVSLVWVTMLNRYQGKFCARANKDRIADLPYAMYASNVHRYL